MATSQRTPVSPQVAHSLRTLVIASKSRNNNTYHPPVRTIAVIVPDDLSQSFPGFLIEESQPAGRESAFYRVDDFEAATMAFAEPLPG